MISRKGLIWVLLLLIGGVSIGQSLFYENMNVQEIKFEGLVNTEESELAYLIYIDEGEALEEDELNQTVKTLYGLDRFSDCKADIEESTNGLIVTFILEENPYIRDILVEGNDSIRKSDLEDGIYLDEDSHYTEAKMLYTVAGIKKLYKEDGFIEVEVDYELTPVEEEELDEDTDEDQYDLTIMISEGEKIVVEDIIITGAENIPASDIKGVMSTKEKVFILQSGVLEEETFLDDKEMITALYQQQGYLDMELTDYRWEVETLGEGKKEHEAIVIYIDVDEGDQYTTGEISITNNTIFTKEELREFIDLEEADVYDQLSVEMAKYEIFNEYSDLGHLYANVSVVETKDTNENVVDAEFVIYEGPRAHIESVSISGNEKTKDYVIERELLFEEGELYVQSKVRESYELLTFLQYFSEINFVPTPGSSEGLIGMDIQVEEQRTGLLTFGVGYGTESGFNATAMVSEQNLLGTGRTLSFKGEYGQFRQLVELSFKEPWLFQTPTFANISINYSRYLYDDIPTDDDGDGKIDSTTNTFDYISNSTETLDYLSSTNSYIRESFGIGLSLSRRFLVDWNTFISYNFYMYDDRNPNFTTPLIYVTSWDTNYDLIESLTNSWTTKHSIGLGLSVNTTDSPISPSKGVDFSLNLYYNGGIFGGSIHYIKPKVSLNMYWNPFWEFVLATHLSTEFVLPQFSFDGTEGAFDYDTSDMLWFDGVYEMRGWQNYPNRGESKAFYSAEWRWPLYQEYLTGLLFFDIGSLWSEYDLWSFNGSGYLSSFGIGLKINIPQLPIRLYLARKAQYFDELGEWHLEGYGDGGTANNDEFFKNWQVVFSIQGLF